MTLAGEPGEGEPLARALGGTQRPVSSAPAHVVRRGAVLVAIAASVIALDQWSKSWALHHLSLTRPRHVIGPVYLVLSFNRGAAFSLGSGASPVIEAVAALLVALVIAFSGRVARGGANPAVVVGLGLLCGGALSNLADRFLRAHHGAVVDFIQAVSWWPTFNVADAAVSVGAVTVGVGLVFFSRAKGDAHEQR